MDQLCRYAVAVGLVLVPVFPTSADPPADIAKSSDRAAKSTPPPASEETPDVRDLIDKAAAALRDGRSPSESLANPEYRAVHEWPRFRQVVRQSARSAPLTMVAADEPGVPLIVVGRVMDREGRPAAAAVVYAYHTSAKGWYSDRAAHVAAMEGDRKHARLFGYLLTDAQGRFEIHTIRPGGYPDSDLPTHIHVELTPRGADRPNVITEIVFADDPRLTDAARTRAIQEGFVVATVRREGAKACRVEVELRLR